MPLYNIYIMTSVFKIYRVEQKSKPPSVRKFKINFHNSFIANLEVNDVK